MSVDAEKAKRGLRRVVSMNLRTPDQLEKVAQSMEDLESLMQLKKILTNADVFEPVLEMDHSERGAYLKNKKLLNAEVRKSGRVNPEDFSEEMQSEAARLLLSKNNQKKASMDKDLTKKSSFKDLPVEVEDELDNETVTPTVFSSPPRKKEEWEDVDENYKKEFWREMQEIQGDYHYGVAVKGWRDSMEDTFDAKSSVKSDVPNMFGVYDGHGGAACAQFCKTFLLQQLSKRPDLGTNTVSVLTNQFLSVNAEFNRDQSSQAGSTATVLVVAPIDVEQIKKTKKNDGTKAKAEADNPKFAAKKKKSQKPNSKEQRLDAAIKATASLKHNKHEFKFYCAAAGDSRAAIVYSHGNTIPLSVDHNLKRKDELERIKGDEGEIRYDPEFNDLLVYSPEAQRGLNVTRSIGDRDFEPLVTALPEVKEGYLTKDAAFFVIASDGLWGKVNTDEVGRILVEYGLEQGVRNLLDLANKRETGDNTTVLAVDIQKMLSAMEEALQLKSD